MEGGEYIQRKKKKEKNNNRRFSDEQIKCLESMFEVETKLEPRKKVQLARELGLQPRQVAIWFQNRRARWKAKQIEQEYRVLKADFDNLNSRYELVNKEKQSLLTQLQKLSDLLKKPQNEGRGNKDLEGNSTDSGSDNGDRDFKAKPSCLCDGLDNGVVMYSDDDERKNIGYPSKKEETELLNLGEQVDGSLVPQEKWSNFDSGGLFDHTHTYGTSNWWDFWT